MSDRLTPAERSLRMAAVRQKHTGPEIFVRRLLHRSGFRFKLSNQQLPGSPDILLMRWRKAIFVNGCFWHGHYCHLFKLPATRTAWWAEKVDGNRLRDRRVEAALINAGWLVVTVWQCALKGKHKLDVTALQELLVRQFTPQPHRSARAMFPPRARPHFLQPLPKMWCWCRSVL
jgi:DNA mismatch endonuclease (patch repair protein)